MLCSPQLLLPSLAVLLYGGGVIDRYTRPEMGRIWSEESKYQAWLRVELAVCEAYARRGRIPADAMARIRQRARVDVARILVIQERVKHEMIALLTSLEEQVGEDSRFIHIGLTTSDVWDTATALQLRDAVDLLIEGQERLEKALGMLALRHKDTLTIGRTHGVHAEPTTFGLKVAVWYTEAGRNLERLRRARLRARASRPDQCAGGPGKRGAVARARHQSLLGRARHPAGLDDRAGLSPPPHHVHRRGARRRPGPDDRESRAEPRPGVLAARAVEAHRRGPSAPGRL